MPLPSLLVPALATVSTASGHTFSAVRPQRPASVPTLASALGLRAPHLPLKRREYYPLSPVTIPRRSLFARLSLSHTTRCEISFLIFCQLSLVTPPRSAVPATRHRRILARPAVRLDAKGRRNA